MWLRFNVATVSAVASKTNAPVIEAMFKVAFKTPEVFVLDATADKVATLNLNLAVAPGSFTLTAGDTDVVVTGSKALTLAAGSAAGSINASALTGVVTATVETGNLEITSGSGNDVLTITSTDALAVLDAGAGRDTVTVGHAAAGTITGGSGSDTLNVTAAVNLGSATITGFEVIDVNTYTVGIDADVVSGQSVVIDSGASGILQVRDALETVDLSLLTFSSSTTAATNVDVANRATMGTAASMNVTGSSVKDTIVLGNGTNNTNGAGGNDTITGGSGVDTIFGGSGDDRINTGDGTTNYVSGDAGADSILGGTGRDELLGGADNDTLIGGSGNDTLNGGDGADSISGGDGADTLTGGAGNDVFVFDTTTDSTVSAFDTIIDLGTGDTIMIASTTITLEAEDTAGTSTAAAIKDGIATFTHLTTAADWDTLAEKVALIDAVSAIATTESVMFTHDSTTFIYIQGGSSAANVIVKLTGVALPAEIDVVVSADGVSTGLAGFGG